MSEFLLSKELFGVVALILTFAAFFPYIQAILREETRPHVFSWFIWGAGTVVVFIAQLLDGGGIGAWVIGVSGLITFLVAALALRKAADTSIVRMDGHFCYWQLALYPYGFYGNGAFSGHCLRDWSIKKYFRHSGA